MDAATRRAALRSQVTEITEHEIYAWLAARSAAANAKVLRRIAADELRHYGIWKGLTAEEARPRRLVVWWYLLLARTLGITFALKLMEGGEGRAQGAYRGLRLLPGIPAMLRDEQRHEHDLIAMLADERLEYIGSIVLGLNDALVELTGALAGFTLALQSSGVVALAGFIAGFAAALSMAASGYLAAKEEAGQNSQKSPLKAAIYTGVTYFATVLLLIAPYLLLGSVYAALALTLGIAVVVIACYTFYITTAKGGSFWARFLGMAAISLVVAAISFAIGWAAKAFLGVQV